MDDPRGNFFDPDLEAAELRFRDEGRDLRKVPMELRKGQVSFHHCRTLHGSGPNRTDRPRQSIAVHLQDAANAYRVAHDADGHQHDHPNNRLARRVDGKPDYTDERYFPSLWPSASSGD